MSGSSPPLPTDKPALPQQKGIETFFAGGTGRLETISQIRSQPVIPNSQPPQKTSWSDEAESAENCFNAVIVALVSIATAALSKSMKPNAIPYLHLPQPSHQLSSLSSAKLPSAAGKAASLPTPLTSPISLNRSSFVAVTFYPPFAKAFLPTNYMANAPTSIAPSCESPLPIVIGSCVAGKRTGSFL